MHRPDLYVVPLPISRQVIELQAKAETYLKSGLLAGLSEDRLVQILDEENLKARQTADITAGMAIAKALCRALDEARALPPGEGR